MRTDTLALAALLGLALIAVTVLAALQAPIPDVLGYGTAALVGAVTGSALPGRYRPQHARD